jgi:SAM-dependent methyltransferase
MHHPEYPPGTPTLVNAGAGPRGRGQVSPVFDTWRVVRVDVEPAVKPDILGSITDLAEIPDDCADAVWASHCLEHLFQHEVPKALSAFRRVLNDRGFLCLFVPDLASLGRMLAEDALTEVIYDSAAGPVTPHDMLYGFAPAIEHGQIHMAHRCGFTPSVLQQRLTEAGFEEFVLGHRRHATELTAVASKRGFGGTERRDALMAELGL